MIDPVLYAAFLGATVLLMLIPGPNVALIVANSVAHGARYGLMTVAGTSTATFAQLLLVVLGLGQVLAALGTWLEVLRWVGVGYLVLLGIQQWRAPVTDLSATRADAPSPRRIVRRAFLVSLTNPKTLFFYGAFFPQFVRPGHDVAAQVLILATSLLAVAIGIDSLWALLAARVRPLLARNGRLRNRITGGLLIGAGAGLAAARGD